ncbi:rab32, member RAS oncoprotein, variant 2 [Balamuthia mandrillaris]
MGAGKTAIIRRYVNHSYSEGYKSTIGVDFALKEINYDSKSLVRLQLWDIAGQERYGNMTRVYYKEAVGAFVVFDMARVSTFEAVQKWKSDIDSKIRLSGDRPIPVVLLANKCDLVPQGCNEEVMNQYVKENGFVAWFPTSAKENTNVDLAVNTLVDAIMKRVSAVAGHEEAEDRTEGVLKLTENGNNKNQGGGREGCNC